MKKVYKNLNINVNKGSIKWIVHLIGPIVFIIILLRLDLHNVWQSILSAKLFYLILAILSQIISILLKCQRWRIIIALYQKLPFFQVLKASIYGFIYASITPGKVGEGFKAPLIKNPSLRYSQIFFSIIVDRLLDVLPIILAGYLSLIYLRNVIKVDIYVLLSITAGLILIFTIAYYLYQRLRKNRLFDHSQNKFTGINNWLHNDLNLIIDNIFIFSNRPASRKIFSRAISMSILLYFFYFLAVYFIALSINLDISFMFMVLCFSAVSFLALLPISISGIGTRDISLIFFFNMIGISAEKAIAFSLIILSIMTYGTLLLYFLMIEISEFLKVSWK